jgi:t-SNARE complex subunit (syntaxin)
MSAASSIRQTKDKAAFCYLRLVDVLLVVVVVVVVVVYFEPVQLSIACS